MGDGSNTVAVTALSPRRAVSLGGRGPEDVVADSRGGVLTGLEDGRIVRVEGLRDPDRTGVKVVAETGGRPLGLELLPDNALLVCDAERGLLRVGLEDGVVRVLADRVAGVPLRFCSNVVNACRARCSRSLSAFSEIPSATAASRVERPSISPSSRATLYFSGSSAMAARTIVRVSCCSSIRSGDSDQDATGSA